MQIPEGVEHQAGCGQKKILIPAPEGELSQQKDRRQETEEENRRAEYQTIFPLPLRMIKKQFNQTIIAFFISIYNSRYPDSESCKRERIRA